MDAVVYCQRIGRAVRQELGQALQPVLGWDSNKFTAQAAACRTRPGHLLAVAPPRERTFLQPLSVALLPLPVDALQRLGFLGLRTLGQYAALPPTVVGLQFGKAGRLAHRCARGEDDRPVIPRYRVPSRTVGCELGASLAEREQLLAVLGKVLSIPLAELRGELKACGQVRLRVDFDDGNSQERARTFLFPTADMTQVIRASGQLLDGMRWRARAIALAVALEQIQDMVAEQLTLFPVEDERKQKLHEVQRYLMARFGANRLQRIVIAQPGAPLPEWRVSWVEENER
jgi:nucleotidyltransferase/DNA polymerase involved in DNA repair